MYFQCFIQYGLSVVKSTYATDEPLLPGLSFKTGLISQEPLSASKSWAYNGTAINGSTDGLIVENFKSQKALGITEKSKELENMGVTYNSNIFNIDSASISYITAVMVSILDGENMTGQIYPTQTGMYTFLSNADAKSLYSSMKGRLNSIYGGQKTLLDSVTSAANTQAAMDAIVDSRT